MQTQQSQQLIHLQSKTLPASQPINHPAMTIGRLLRVCIGIAAAISIGATFFMSKGQRFANAIPAKCALNELWPPIKQNVIIRPATLGQCTGWNQQ